MKAAVPLLALLLGLGLGACGGSASSTATTDSSEQASRVSVRVAPLEVSGGGSAQLRVEGGDNSIQNYGTEASAAELRRAAIVAHSFFAALAEEDWMGACARMDARQRGQIARLGAAGGKQGAASCPSGLELLIGKVSAADGREATVLDAVALRRDGGRAFLLYRGSGGSPYFIAMSHQSGWAVAGLTPTPLG